MNVALLILILGCSATCLADKWVDPHDMNTNVKSKYTQTASPEKSTSTSYLNNDSFQQHLQTHRAYIKRVVSVIISSAHISQDNDMFKGHIRFTLQSSDLKFLQDFAKEDVNLESLRRLDTIFSENFKRSFVEEYLDTVEYFQVKLYSLIVNIYNLWLLGAISLLYVIYQLFKHEFSFAYIIKYIIIVVIVVDFGFRYQFLLEEADKHNLGVVYSKDCDTNMMGWLDWTKFIFSSRNCEKKTVTPLDALLYQVKTMIIVPLHAFGTGLGGFGKDMFINLPWGLNLVMWPLMLIFTLLLVLLVLSMCFGQTVELNIFHLLKFKFGSTNSLGMPFMERLLDRDLHRPMVESVVERVEGNQSSPIGDGNDVKDTREKGTNTCYVPTDDPLPDLDLVSDTVETEEIIMIRESVEVTDNILTEQINSEDEKKCD